MKTVKINYQGIARAASQQDIADGWCDEIINLRFRNGKLIARGKPTSLYYLPTEVNTDEPEAGPQPIQWSKIWKHEQNGISNFVGFTNINYLPNALRLIDFEAGTTTVIKEYDSITDVRFLKRYMIVVYADGIDRFVWKNGQYVLTSIDVMPQFSLYLSDIALTETTVADGPFDITEVGEQIRGFYYSKLNEMSADNYFTGAMAVRAAFKMFDGSYIMHTIPRVISVTDMGIGFKFDKLPQTSNVSVRFTTAKLKTILLKSFYEQIADLKDVVSSVVIFGSKFETVVKVDDSIDDEINDAVDAVSITMNQVFWLNDIITTVNPDFKNLCDTASWYKIGEYQLSNILDDDINEELDLNDFYQDYATRETLPVDSFSHHQIGGAVAYNYNSRLNLGNTSTKFGDYRFFPLNTNVYGAGENLIVPPGYTESGTLNVRMLVTISTDSGDILKLGQAFERPKFVKPGESGTVWYIAMGLGEFGYPDARATKIEVLYERDILGWVKSPLIYALKKSANDNFAYFIDKDFTTARQDHYFGTANFPIILHRIDAAVVNVVQLSAYPEQKHIDQSRVQISELNNPFYFPAENSYQVGTGEILQIATNTEPLSTGQFGEYPLIVFTGAGTWALLQGQGDVLFSSVKPLNGEVINNPDSVISVPGGVVFTTSKGLYLQSGGEKPVWLSESIEGSPNFDLNNNESFKLRVNRLQLIQVPNAISEVDFVIYIQNAVIGYDKVLNELLVTNSEYQYSYIYSFDSGKWTKISESYPVIINAYPKILPLIYANNAVYDFSNENFYYKASGVIVTRPCKIEGNNAFILLHRALQRCEINTGVSFAGFYCFGANDLINWQLVSGNDKKSGRVIDILTSRAHLKLKYFVFVFASALDYNSVVNSVVVQYYEKLQNKIR